MVKNVRSCTPTFSSLRGLHRSLIFTAFSCCHLTRTHFSLPGGPSVARRRRAHRYVLCKQVTWWRSWLRHCATSRQVAGSTPDCVNGIFIDITLPAALGVDSCSNRNAYQEYFLGAKGYKYTLRICIIFFFFHCNNGCTNATQCYGIRTLTGLFYVLGF